MEDIRPELVQFVEAMEAKLRKHDAERGNSWKTCDAGFLQNRLSQELREYTRSGDRKELTDIANFCMFLWWREE